MTPEEDKDLEIRKEFAKAFGWYETQKDYGYSTSTKGKLKEPSWFEIFTELGKILKSSEIKNDIENTIRNTIRSIQNESIDLN